MGNFIWINFWIVLVYVCFQANSSPTRRVTNINVMQKYVKCEEDSEFYTPIAENVTAECITAALECFLTELKTVRQECEDPEEAIDFTQEFLEEHIEKRQEAAKNGALTSAVCPCESWPKKPLTEHLTEMGSVAQRVLSAASQLYNRN